MIFPHFIILYFYLKQDINPQLEKCEVNFVIMYGVRPQNFCDLRLFFGWGIGTFSRFHIMKKLLSIYDRPILPSTGGGIPESDPIFKLDYVGYRLGRRFRRYGEVGHVTDRRQSFAAESKRRNLLRNIFTRQLGLSKDLSYSFC